MSILGYELYQGPEIAPDPIPENTVLSEFDKYLRYRRWRHKIREQIKAHNAWGVIIVTEKGEVKLYGADDTLSLMQATRIGAVAYLVLAREYTGGRGEGEQ